MRVRPFRILCLACSAERLEALRHLLKRDKEFLLLAAATADHAVAFCAAHVIAAALVDAESIRGHEWTVVKSLKLVKPNLPVILLDERKRSRAEPPPEGVTEVLAASSDEEVFQRSSTDHKEPSGPSLGPGGRYRGAAARIQDFTMTTFFLR